MARTAKQNADLVFRAQDKATPTIKKVGRTLSKTSADFNKGSSAMAGFSQVGTQLTSRLGVLSGGINEISGNMIALTSVAAASGVVMAKAMFDLAASAAAANDEIFDLSVRFGIAAETVSQLKFVAEQSGSSIQDLGNAFKTLSKNASTNSAEFKKWGVTLRDSNGVVRDQEALFFAAIDAINELEDDTRKTAAAQDLFGRSGSNMLQVIKLGSAGIQDLRDRADEYGFTISEAAAIQGNQFNNAMHQTVGTVANVKREMGDELIPTMTFYIEKAGELVNWIREQRESFGNLTSVLGPIVALWNANTAVLGEIARRFGDAKDGAEDLKMELVPLVENVKKVTKATDAKARSSRRAKAADDEWAKVLREIDAGFDDQILAINKATAARIAANNFIVDVEDRQREEKERKGEEAIKNEEERQMESARNVAATIQAMGSVWGAAFEQIAAGSAEAGQAIARAMVSSAEIAINAAAASAGAQAAFATAGIPIIGPALVAGAIALVFGLVRGLLATLPSPDISMARGGILDGGIPFKDSINVSAQRGEGFLDREDTRLIKADLADRRGGRAGTAGITQINNFNAVGALISADTMRATREMNKLQRRAASRGF